MVDAARIVDVQLDRHLTSLLKATQAMRDEALPALEVEHVLLARGGGGGWMGMVHLRALFPIFGNCKVVVVAAILRANPPPM